ncbi:UNVERIFIED_ORG: type I restriction enzyme S subunit [Methylorubrum zatmanii]
MSELPTGWETIVLREIAARGTGTIDPSCAPEEEFELYSVPAFSTGNPETRLGGEIKSVKQVVREGDVLLCKIVPHINRVWTVGPYNGRRQIASGEWIVYRDHHCDPSYLRALLSEGEFRERFLTTVSGVGGSLMRANPKAVAEFEVPLAPVDEQRRIVAKIDRLSAKSKRCRDQLDHIPKLVQRYKQAVLDSCFHNFSFKKPLIDFVDEGRGIPYGIIQTGIPTTNGVPTVRCGDIKDYSVDRSTLKRVDPDIESQYQRTKLRGGEILIAIRGSVGNTCVASDELSGCNISREVAMIPLRKGELPQFFAYYLTSTEARSYILGNVKGVAQQGINLADLRGVPAPMVKAAVQEETVRRIESAFSWIDRLAAEATSARKLIDRLDQAVLAKAFRGELVPQDPADEPASVLLDRIRAERVGAPAAKRRGRPRAPALL